MAFMTAEDYSTTDKKPAHIITDPDSINRLAVDTLKVNRPGAFYGIQALNGSSPDLNVDGSVTPVNFDIVANSGKKYIIKRIIITMIDESINFDKFAGISALTNGIDLKTKEGGLAERSLGDSIQTNADFYKGGLSVLLESSTTDILTLVFEFNSVDTSLILTDSASDYFRITVNDDLTSINTFVVRAQGYEVDE